MLAEVIQHAAQRPLGARRAVVRPAGADARGREPPGVAQREEQHVVEAERSDANEATLRGVRLHMHTHEVNLI